MGTEPRLEARDLSKRFDGTVAVDGVDLAPRDGEFVAILGPSGCGKTTLLRMVAGFEPPDGGTIRMGGRLVSDGDRGIVVPPERRRIGMVFQTYAVWPHMTAADNVAYPLRLRRVNRAERRRRVAEILDLVGLAGLERRLPNQLSGGQQQRVALARALVAEPDLLLLDEPLSNLDAKLRERMRRDLRRIQHEVGVTTVLVTHDQAEAMELADRIVVLRDGRVEQAGAPEALYRAPANAFVADFLGKANLLAGRGEGRRWVGLSGGYVEVPEVGPPTATIAVIRPEDLLLDPSGQDAVVLEQTFAGATTTYRLRWGTEELLATSHPDHDIRPAQPVGLRAVRVHYLDP
ncbi:MAG: ABC transporter ATP-binding protein [Egibacteraceae bacterium]